MATERRLPLGVIRATLVTALACVGVGCAGLGREPPSSMVVPPNGIFFASFKAPLTQDFHGNPTGPNIKVVSESSVRYFYDFLFTGLSFAWDEATIEKIARERGMKKVSYADYEFMHVMGFFAITTINVYGE